MPHRDAQSTHAPTPLPLFGGGRQSTRWNTDPVTWSGTPGELRPEHAASDERERSPYVVGPADVAREAQYLAWRADTGRALLPYPYGEPLYAP